MIQATTYINIQDWMVEKLKLSGNELVVYALIHGFSQDGYSVFRGKAAYIAKKTGMSDRRVFDVLQRLVKKGYLAKKDIPNYTFTTPDGEQKTVRAQGGANHFCIYWTVISRTNQFPNEDNVQDNRTVEHKPTDKLSYGIPSDKTSVGDQKVIKIISTDELSYGSTDKMSVGTTDEMSYAPTDKMSHNNKHETKDEITTSTKEISLEIVENLLSKVFGSSSLFKLSFINALVKFLNSKQIDFDKAQDYITWAYNQSKLKAKKDLLGLFISTVLLDSFYAQFLFYSQSIKKIDTTNKIIHCPICNYSFDKQLSICPHCKTDVSDFDNSSLVNLKKQIIALPLEERNMIEQELRDAECSLFDKDNLSAGKKISKEQLNQVQLRKTEIYQRYGIFQEVN